MNSIATFLLAAVALGGTMDTAAQTKPAASAHAGHVPPTAMAAELDIPAVSRPAVAVVERFGKALSLLSTESMVLRKTGADWRIVHIHWSSRPKKAK